MNAPTQEQAKQSQHITKLEWAVSLIGALLFFALLAYLIYDVIQDQHQPPQLSVSIQQIQEIEGLFLVEFQVHNAGDRTAADLTIEGSLSDATQTAETHTLTIDYLPPYSNREAGLIFTHNPADYTLKILPTGYQTP